MIIRAELGELIFFLTKLLSLKLMIQKLNKFTLKVI